MSYGRGAGSSGESVSNPIINGDARINQIAAVDTDTEQSINGSGFVYNNVDQFPLVFMNGTAAFSVNDSQRSNHPILGSEGFSKAFQCTENPTIEDDLYVGLSTVLCSDDLMDYIDETVSVSFSVNAPKAGVYYVALVSGDGLPGSNATFVSPFSVDTAGAWERKTVPISLPSSVFDFDAGDFVHGLTIHWPMIGGSDFYATSAKQKVWNASPASALYGSDIQNMVNLGATERFMVTDVLLHKQSVSSVFPRQNFNAALLAAQRFYEQSPAYGTLPVANLTAAGALSYRAPVGGISPSGIILPFRATKRATPKMRYFTPSAAGSLWRNTTAAANSASPTSLNASPQSVYVSNPQVAGDSAGDLMALHFAADARLGSLAVGWVNNAAVASARDWRGIAWSPDLNLFAAVPDTGTFNTSPDGKVWTDQASGNLTHYNDIVWSPELGIFCAVCGASGSPRAEVSVSSDGETWTQNVIPSSAWFKIAWSPSLGLFCACGKDNTGTNCFATSPDGETWTARARAGARTEWTALTWADGLGIFVALANDAAAQNVNYSDDGVTWTAAAMPSSIAPTDLAYSPELNRLVAVGTAVHKFAYSDDGINWTVINSPEAINYNAVAWSPALGIFVAVGASGKQIATSSDGINWISRAAPVAKNFTAIAWSDALNLFCSMANSGGDVMLSGS